MKKVLLVVLMMVFMLVLATAAIAGPSEKVDVCHDNGTDGTSLIHNYQSVNHLTPQWFQSLHADTPQAALAHSQAVYISNTPTVAICHGNGTDDIDGTSLIHNNHSGTIDSQWIHSVHTDTPQAALAHSQAVYIPNTPWHTRP